MVKKLTMIEPFLAKPKESLHLADISRQLNDPHPTARLQLNLLEKEGLLKKEHKGRLTMYSLNLENLAIIDYLIVAEKLKLIKSREKWQILGELISYIYCNTEENIKALIFGSAVESSAANDIDLLIVGKQNLKKLEEFGRHIGIELHIINVANLKKITSALRNEIVKKHLLIKGSEDFVRWMLW